MPNQSDNKLGGRSRAGVIQRLAREDSHVELTRRSRSHRAASGFHRGGEAEAGADTTVALSHLLHISLLRLFERNGTRRLNTYEAQRQVLVLERAIHSGPVPLAELPTDVVSSLVRVGLLEETEKGVGATPAARHFSSLIAAL